MRLIDFLKKRGTTALFTSLTSDAAAMIATSEVGISSLMDSWVLLSNLAYNGERTRTLQVLKSRGMSHSNQIREFVMTKRGVDLVDVYMHGEQVLTGAARVAHEARMHAANELLGRDHARRRRDLAGRRQALDAQIAALNLEAERQVGDVEFAIERERLEAEATRSSPGSDVGDPPAARARRPSRAAGPKGRKT
jgi:circadian clock protein KaiC